MSKVCGDGIEEAFPRSSIHVVPRFQGVRHALDFALSGAEVVSGRAWWLGLSFGGPKSAFDMRLVWAGGFIQTLGRSGRRGCGGTAVHCGCRRASTVRSECIEQRTAGAVKPRATPADRGGRACLLLRQCGAEVCKTELVWPFFVKRRFLLWSVCLSVGRTGLPWALGRSVRR